MPEAEQNNWSAAQALDVYETRLGLVTRQLARSPYLAGEAFTAADISVTGGATLGEVARAYVDRTTGREGYTRATDACH